MTSRARLAPRAREVEENERWTPDRVQRRSRMRAAEREVELGFRTGGVADVVIFRGCYLARIHHIV